MDTRKILFGSILIALLAFVAACTAPTAPPATIVPQPSITSTVAPRPTTAPTSAPMAQLDKITLAYGSPVPALPLLPLDVAQALDLFKQEGLEVTMNRMPRLTANSQILLGQADFAGEGFNPSDTQLSGKSAQAVTSLARLPGSTLVVKSDMKDRIKSLSDLTGQKINYGGAPGVFLYLIAQAGLKPEEVQFVEDGRNVAQIEADLENGVGVAAILIDPYTTRAIQSGKAYALVDLATKADAVKWLGGEYQSASLMTTTDTIKNRPQAVQKMTNALVKALRYIGAHSAVDITAILPPEVVGNDKALFARALQHAMPMFSKDGLVIEADVKNAVQVNKAMGAIKPDQQIDINSLYTNEFVDNVK